MHEQELNELFEVANLEIKKTEQVNGGIVVPALNELRHASEHRARAEKATDAAGKESELQKASAHYLRASIDAIEARIFYQLDTFTQFQKNFSDFVKKQDIPAYIEAVKAAQEAQNNLTQLSVMNQKSDIFKLKDIAENLEKNLSLLLQNKQILYESISKTKSKWKQGIFTSMFGLIASIIASLLSFYTPSTKPPDEVLEQIRSLDAVQKSIENLQTYVSRQKATLTDLNRNVTDLKNQKAELEKIVQSGSETVDTILRGYERRQQANRWKDIAISFFVGVFSSLTAALLYEYNRRRKRIPNLNAVNDSIKQE